MLNRAILDADALADHGDYTGALSEYDRLSQLAKTDTDLQYLQFRSAYMLERLGDAEGALAAYAQMYLRPTSNFDEVAARAMYRVGRVYRDLLSDPATAQEVWLSTVRAYPDTTFAFDALRQLEDKHVKEKRYDALIDLYSRLFVELQQSEMAYFFVYRSGVILQEKMKQCEAAMEMFHVVSVAFPRTGVADDGQWRTGECLRSLGRTDDEYRWLMDFIAGQENSIILGDYNSKYYNPSYMRLAEIHEEREEWARAIAVYRRFQETFPLSLDNDDVQFRIIELYEKLGDVGAMRRYSAELKKLWPESRYVRRAEALVQKAESRR